MGTSDIMQCNRDQSLGMTTPVISSAGQGTPGNMEFPIAAEGAEEPTDLPIPDNARLAANQSPFHVSQVR